MKLFHTSDWHLGRMLGGRSMLEDQHWFLEQAFLPAIRRERPACVLLCGDIYDRQIAPPEAIRLFDSTLTALTELGCKVCAISGNHDGADRIAILKGVLRGSGIYFSTGLEDAFSPVLLEENGEKVQLFPLPYFDAAQAREFLGDDTLRGEGACMQRLIDRMTPLFEPGAAHVLLAHCFAAGSSVSDSESGLFVGGAGEVAPKLFDAFDYVALGHLHGPQKAGEKGFYSGSPLKYSVDEERQKKGYRVLEWNGEQLSSATVEVTPPRDVRRVSGLFEDLLRLDKPCEDYVELTLADKAPIFRAAERLRIKYPNLLAVSNPWAVSGEVSARARRLQNKDETTVFSSFLKEICGVEAEEEDLAIFREVLGEVRE